MNREKKNSIRGKAVNFLLVISLPALLLILWEIGVKNGSINGNVIPAPSKLFDTFIELVRKGKLQEALTISFGRVIKGFLIAAAIGITLGFLMGIFASFNRMLSSLVNILRPIPVVALIPILIIILGVGESANVSIIVIGALWPILLNTTAGVMSTDRKLLELAYVYRLSKPKQYFKIVLPSALYSILTGLRLGVSGAWMSVVAAEMIGATSGIGYLIMFSKSLAQAANMYVLVLVVGIIGYLIDKLLLTLQNRISKRFVAGRG